MKRSAIDGGPNYYARFGYADRDPFIWWTDETNEGAARHLIGANVCWSRQRGIADSRYADSGAIILVRRALMFPL